MSLQIPDNHDRSALRHHHHNTLLMNPKQEQEVVFHRNLTRTKYIQCLRGTQGFRELIKEFYDDFREPCHKMHITMPPRRLLMSGIKTLRPALPVVNVANELS